MTCSTLDALADRLAIEPSPAVLVETARALEAHGWRFGKTTRQTLVLATLDVERRHHMETATERERWAAGMWISTDPDHRHLLRMMEAPTIDTHVDRGASFMDNDLRLVVECDPPTFWCELPADHPARG